MKKNPTLICFSSGGPLPNITAKISEVRKTIYNPKNTDTVLDCQWNCLSLKVCLWMSLILKTFKGNIAVSVHRMALYEQSYLVVAFTRKHTRTAGRPERVRSGLRRSPKECDCNTAEGKQRVGPPTTRCPLRCCLIKQWRGLQEARIDLPISAWFHWNLLLGWKPRAQMCSRRRSDWTVMSLPASWICANGSLQTLSRLGAVNAFSSQQGD